MSDQARPKRLTWDTLVNRGKTIVTNSLLKVNQHSPLTLTLTLLLTACTPRVIYQKVYIPTKCNIIKPERPPKSLHFIDYLKELLIYTERLEKDLEFCTKENAMPTKTP